MFLIRIEHISDSLILFFFAFSFGFSIIFGLIYCIKSFSAGTLEDGLSNIIHSYIGIILIFAATYYQCIVVGDYNDSINKEIMYKMQRELKKEISPDLTFMKVIDQRAFKGIVPRLWSGIDYPSMGLLFNHNGKPNPDLRRTFTNSGYDDLSIDQIERITNNINDFTEVCEYLPKNCKTVYIDCLYYSVICIATVGFGDISPNLWYTKLFTATEVLFGLTIFIFAIGFLFTKWTSTN
ncbi:MAG: two pore domain potassium channel family protein [Saprospiraceae bacterium]|nr:two pore domain potassium channel family protein [Saprospiraceae bacterium]